MDQTGTIVIQQCAPDQAAAVASLHRQCIRTGFLSRLGLGFLAALYKSIGRSPYSRIFVAVNQDLQKVVGFAACSLNTAAMYRHILLRRGVLFFFLLLPNVFFPGNLKFIIETFFYPQKGKKKARARNGNAGPQAELLSIAVSDDCRKKGVGRDLLDALESYLKENKVTSYKTVTLSTDPDANAFYKKCGFVFNKEMAHHGNILYEYIKNLRP
jgi:ribosomal protein S18 acetylase RimI-like enzyme